jgi:hypothetical protein
MGVTLAAAVGAYIAKTLGVTYPDGGRGRIFVRPRLPIPPQELIGKLILLGVVAYLATGILAGVADWRLDDKQVPAVIAAQWKILLGLVVATFVAVLSEQKKKAN